MRSLRYGHLIFFQNVGHLGFDPPENGTIGSAYLKSHTFKRNTTSLIMSCS